RDLTDCDTAVVAWWLDGDVDPATEPTTQLSGTELDLVRSATTSQHPVFSSDDRRIAIRLFETNSFDRSRAILLLAAGTRPDAQRLVNDIAEPLKLAGRHLSRALESAALKSANRRLQRSESLQHALFAISDLAGSERDMPDMLRGIHAIVGTLMYAENFYIVLHDPEADTLRFLYYVDVEDPETPGDHRDVPMNAMARSLTWYLLRDGKPLMGSTEQLHAQVSGPLVVIGTDSHDWLGVPMRRDGHVHGAIVVQSYQESIGYSADDLTLLEFVGNHILIALERKLGKDDLEQRVRLRTLELDEANQVLQLEIIERERNVRLQAALLKIAQLATADISQVEFYRSVHVVAGELINATNLFIALLTEDGQSLEFAYVIDETNEPYETRPLGRGASEYVLRHGTAILSSADMLELVDRGEMDRDAIGGLAVCWLGVPLSVGDQTIGLIVVQSYDPAVVYGPADQELLSFVASQVANSLHRRRSAETLRLANAQLERRVQERTQDLRAEIVQRERAQEQLKHQIMHDGLTGLPNRAYLRDRLERVLQRLKREPGRRYALLFMDVDRFKLINDSLGHLAGDTVLKEVARRLQTCIRQPDIVVRLSGDEFAILLEDIRIPDTAVKVAQRVLAVMVSPLQLKDGAVVEPSVSVGVAICDANYLSADDVLRDADAAMYRAKKSGRKRFELFDDSLQKNAVDVLEMEIKLRAALLRDQFEPYFQPIVRLATGDVVGYEALLRWNHPTRGVIGPDEFLQIAQDNGSIETVDWKMFEMSCKLATTLDPAHYVTINVSPQHFRHADFDATLLALVERCGLPPSRLIIELHEGSMIDQPERVRATLDRLRAAGIGAALDDFGTGYSSLSYLHTFSLRMLKIDRSFVAGLDKNAQNSSAKVVAAVIAMAHALEMDVVAEGIETTEQRDALMALGCVFGQGYLLGRPAPIGRWTAPSSKLFPV
ncbi:MAG TPA: EAL domain-containing protein, partial [Xanthomonadaceae bacterium]|nr:EAL domain-containing protein [Xanthomonadaceae bacterium]